ncbi:MAG: hypothetical protein V7708_02835 [Oceanicoccus sp.]
MTKRMTQTPLMQRIGVPETVSITEASRQLGMDFNRLKAMVASGEIPSTNVYGRPRVSLVSLVEKMKEDLQLH